MTQIDDEPSVFHNRFSATPTGAIWHDYAERIALACRRPRAESLRPLRPNRSFLCANRAEPTLTWLGHATFLLQIAGVNILTDPHLSARTWPWRALDPKRAVPPPMAVGELPHIHAVVISHNHREHLDRATIEGLTKQRNGMPRFFVPLGLRAWIRARSYAKCVELDWWQWSQFMGVTFHFVPGQHWSGRSPWDTNRSLWGGWVIDHPHLRFYFAGDAGYSTEFLEIGRRFAPIDLAALPIGGHEPGGSLRHYQLSPEDALSAHRDVGARHSVAMSWGTFLRARETLSEPPRRLADARGRQGMLEHEFFVMQPGETRSLNLLDAAIGASAVATRLARRSRRRELGRVLLD